MKYIDLHNHSVYSRDGSDTVEALIKNAIHCGIDVIGITDHNYWFMDRIEEYKDEILSLKSKYSSQVRVLLGMEIATVPFYPDLLPSDLDDFDYCIFEHIDHPNGMGVKKFLEYAAMFNCKKGIAHTDIYRFSETSGLDIPALLAENGIFWELNVNYDRVHGFNERKYVKKFFDSKEQQDNARSLGLEFSVGFDTHLLEDYSSQRVKDACDKVNDLGLKLVFQD
ncbi:MAG: PHP domain-containing protein [Clostridiales bacterium]|jgi:histidinol phosphatase-like PHP family hydrolase|nr:PHP domain-containing protein [Clostridiales bacterium]